MTIQTASTSSAVPDAAPGPLIHPRWVRVTHWINALAIFMMIGSGWQIYDASPLFRFIYFPHEIALGEWLAGALLWHFAAMWLLVINDLLAALRGKLSHDDFSVYNAVQRLLYLGVILAGVVIVLSGLSIWKPVQFHPLTSFFGGYNTARYVHFAAMTAIVAFLVVHVSLAVLVPKSLRAMIIGR